MCSVSRIAQSYVCSRNTGGFLNTVGLVGRINCAYLFMSYDQVMWALSPVYPVSKAGRLHNWIMQ